MPTSFTKLDIIQKACMLCGENPPQTEDDGSAEWDVCSARYDLILPVLIQKHGWNFATRMEVLVEAGSNPSQNFDYAYLRPPGAVHVLALWSGGLKIDKYEVLDGKFCTDVSQAAGVTAEYVVVVGPDAASNLFVLGLVEHIRAGVIGGLQEDLQRADDLEAKANLIIDQARSRDNQEEPARDLSVGRVASRRRGYRRVSR
jgi:hypothetical protein